MTTTTEKRPTNSTNVRALIEGAMKMLGRSAPRVALPLAEHLFFRTFRFSPRPFEHDARRMAADVSVSIGERTLVGHSWGAPGPTVLLVHGWNGRATQLAGLIAPLLLRGQRVVAFDLGGHGGSTGTHATAVSLAEDILAIDDAIGPFQGVVAHSFGSAATSLALVAGLRASRVAFVAPPLEAKDWLSRYCRMFGFDWAMQERLRARLERRVGVSFDDLSGRRMAPAMNTPLLVAHDADDREVPLRDGETLAALWPHARFHRTSGLGHMRILSDPTVARAIAQFITQEEQHAA